MKVLFVRVFDISFKFEKVYDLGYSMKKMTALRLVYPFISLTCARSLSLSLGFHCVGQQVRQPVRRGHC